MKVLILGGGGNIGFWVEKLLIENNDYVYSIQRGTQKIKRTHSKNPKNFFIIREDINELSETSKELVNNCDVIIDFVCFSAANARERIRLLSDFPGLLIMISTVAVYDRSLGTNILSSVSSCKNVKWAYAKNKLEAEEALLDGLKPGRVVICRLGHTFDIVLPVPFGVGDWTFVKWLLDGNPLMLFRGMDSRWSLFHSRDVARRILLVAANAENFTSVLNIANPQSVSWLEIGKAIYSTLDIPEKFRYISVDALRNLYPYWSESVIFHKQFDEVYVGDEIKKFSQLGEDDWDLAAGLRISLNFYLRNKPFQTVNQFYYDKFLLLAANSQIGAQLKRQMQNGEFD